MTAQGYREQNSVARFFSEMRRGARNQGNVVFALIFKEIKSRAGGDGYGLYSLVLIALEPAIAVAGMAVFFYFLRRAEIGGVHIGLFLAMSYLPYGLVRRSMTSIPRVLKADAAFYAYQQVKPIDSVLSRFIIETALILLGGMVLFFLLWWVLNLKPNFDHVAELIGIFAMMVATSFGLCLFFAVYGTRFPIILRVSSGSSRALYFLSAIIHPMSEIHDTAGEFLLWNPLAHIVELLRYYALGMKPYYGVNLTYPLGFMLFILFLGLTSYYANRIELLKK